MVTFAFLAGLFQTRSARSLRELARQDRIIDDLRRQVVEANMRKAEAHARARGHQPSWGRVEYPPAYQPLAPWQVVLGLEAWPTASQIEQRFRDLVKQAHPDHGGSADRFTRIMEARTQAHAAVAARNGRAR